MVVAAEAQRIGGARCRQDAEAVGDQVVAEQLQGHRVVLADDDAGDLLSLGQHGRPKSRAAPDSPPSGEGISRTAAAPRCQASRRGGTRRRRRARGRRASRKTRSSAKRMPKVWTLAQRGISRPGPARSRSAGEAEPAQAGSEIAVATGTMRGWGPSRPPQLPSRPRPPTSPPAPRLRSPMTAKPRVAIFGPNPMVSITVESLQRRRRRRHPRPRRRPGRLGGADGGRAGRRPRPLRLHRRRDRARCCGRCWSSCRSSCGWSRPPRPAAPTSTTAAAASASRSPRARRCPPPGTRSTTSSRSPCAAALDVRPARRLRSLPRRRRCRWRSTAAWSPTSRLTGRRSSSTSRSPRLDSALEGRPDLVKINDWELAAYISGPVDTEERMRAAMETAARRGRRGGDRHPRRASRPWRPRRRPLRRADAAALRARLARGLRRLDDGRPGGVDRRRPRAGRSRCASAPRRAPPTSSAHGLGTGARGVVEELSERASAPASPLPTSARPGGENWSD